MHWCLALLALLLRCEQEVIMTMAEDLQQDEAHIAPLGGQGAADVVVAQLPAVTT
jgi:hypothetical protein